VLHRASTTATQCCLLHRQPRSRNCNRSTVHSLILLLKHTLSLMSCPFLLTCIGCQSAGALRQVTFLIFKILRMHRPVYLNDVLRLHRSAKQLRFSEQCIQHDSRHKTELGYRAFATLPLHYGTCCHLGSLMISTVIISVLCSKCYGITRRT
jgi:hypothetical protein